MDRGVFAATEVETTTPRVERSGGAPSGTPLLTASGYVVARRKAVVSAKIQGRLADLRVEEGVREGEVIARLESEDYYAQFRRAQAQVQQAEAQIASGRARGEPTGRFTCAARPISVGGPPVSAPSNVSSVSGGALHPLGKPSRSSRLGRSF